jgi:hypothetical protein
MDYHGTNGNDDIDQKALGLADWTNIFGGAGNDTIRIGNSTADGEAGDDTIIGTTHYSTVAYWSSPAGVTVNLATGIAQDGFGGTDHLSGIYVVQASGFNDRIIGSGSDETFWLGGGSDSVTGGGGHDKVIYYGMKASEATVTYTAATDTFTVVRHPASGGSGTDTLQGIEAIWFQDNGASIEAVTRDLFVEQAGFRRSAQHTAVENMAGAAQLKAGDFNGDGITDVLVSRVNWSDVGVSPVPLQVFLGDGKGGYTDGTAQVFAAGSAFVHYVPRIFVADFNKDGVTDIFTPDFGVDGPPFPGGQNGLFLSSPASHQLVNATSTLPQGLRLTHGTSLGDVNGDGYLDILVNALNNPNGQAEDLLVNDGTGHFVSKASQLPAYLRSDANAAGHTWSMMADLNGDGAADIVLGTWDVNPAPSQVLLNDGHGNFANAAPVDLPRSGVNREIVVGIETIDLNGDALPDLVLSVTNGGANSEFYQVPYLQFLVNDGNGRFHDETQARLPQSKTVAPGATPDWYLSTQIVDLNNDGFQDIVVDDAGGGGPSKVLMNDGHGVFAAGYQSVVGAHLTVADVDGDGMLDLIASSQNGFDVLYNTMANGHVYVAPKAAGAVLGSQLADTLHGAVNNGRIDGGGGLDTVLYQGTSSTYKITHGAAGFTVSHGNVATADTLVNVERIKFADATVALDINGVGGQAYRIYQAAFDRTPDGGGLGFWISAMDKGVTLAAVAQGFVDSKEFKDMYASVTSNSDLVNKFYEHVLHRAPEKGGFEFWVGVLDQHAASVADVLVAISESNENQAGLAPVIGNGFAYTPYG